MTLVATINFQGAPVLFGDIVLSRRPREEETIKSYDIPTFRNVNQTGAVYWICDLKQKIVNVNDRFALGWAGTMNDAKDVIKYLMDNSIDKYYTFDDVKIKLNNINNLSNLNLFLTGIIIEPISENIMKATTFGWDANKGFVEGLIGPKPFGLIFAGGSGKKDFYNTIECMKCIQGGGYAVSKHKVSTMTTLNLLGIFIGDQIRCGFGLDSLYGGGFELLSYQGRRLKKLGGVTYVSLTVKRESNSKYSFNFHQVLKFQYQGDILLIRRTGFFRENDRLNVINANDKLFVIPPIYRTLTEDDKNQVSMPELASNITVYYIYFPQALVNQPPIITRSSFVKRECAWLRFIQHDYGLTIEMTEEFRSYVIAHCDRILT